MVRFTGWRSIALGLICSALILYWLSGMRGAGPAGNYIFETSGAPRFKLARPTAETPIDPRVGNVTISLNGQACGKTPIALKRGAEGKVKGSVLASNEMLPGQGVENVVVGLAYKDRNRLGWSIVGDRGIPGAGNIQNDRGYRELNGTWKVPNVKGEASLIVLVTITQTGKFRPLHTAGVFPVTID